MAWWLERSDGSQLEIGRGGVLVGRSPSCDVVLADRSASREQALLRRRETGVELIALGRNPTRVNGETVSGRHSLAADDAVELPGETLTLRQTPGDPTAQAAVLELAGDLLFGLSRLPLLIGGGRRDDLHIAALPKGALRLHRAQGRYLVELGCEATVDGQAREAGEVVELELDARIAVTGIELRLRGEGPGAGTVEQNEGERLATAVHFQFMPVGGRLELGFPGEAASVELSELRARLVAILLAPPGSYSPGDFVPDEIVLPAVWPREPERDRRDLNLLVHRLRRNLLAEGLNPTGVLIRARNGGATQFRVADNAEVRVG